MSRKRVAILGSTGSIGKNAIKVLRNLQDDFEIAVLTANRNFEVLAEQANEFKVKKLVMADKSAAGELRSLVSDDTQIYSSENSASELIINENIDIVLCAIIGTGGFIPVLNAIKHNKRIALASKEVMVMAGEFINRELLKHPASMIIPVDSEHSALFQCLQGREIDCVKNLILTSSGGPFSNFTLSEMAQVTPEMALKHPVWSMGTKITIDSASMMNKALEVVEAHYLFNLAAEKIQVLVHKEAIIHSMVEFNDNSNLALLSNPSMELPIQYALTYPRICAGNVAPLNLAKMGSLSFAEVNETVFPSLEFARTAVREGGTMGAIMNAANEEAVKRFLRGEIAFPDIWKIVDRVMAKTPKLPQDTLESILESDSAARRIASEI
ncbi:MAG: 1-deoxy-D-xylulose-5-phosphate reductoisomerase [Lentisphaeria bacterium]|nr:1-deoxy-D-xylulose-5-phosphate reductoisomerase [Lentisphaeria bacterium]